MAIEYKWVDGDDLAELEPIIIRNNWASLNPNTSRAICAYEDGVLVGFFVLQLFPHLEPLFVSPSLRGGEVTFELVNRMNEFIKDINIRGFMCVADSQFAEKLCQQRGMFKITSPVYTTR